MPYESIVFRDSLDGGEDALVANLKLGDRLAVVADENTYDALGGRVAQALKPNRRRRYHCIEKPARRHAHSGRSGRKTERFDSVIAVGSGTINDLCKYVTAQDGRRYAVFATAASMNGYTSTTASMTLNSGLKVSLPAQAPAGFLWIWAVSAAAPSHLAASGFADCVARSVAQVDWWMSHRLLGTMYRSVPFDIQIEDEIALNKCAHLLPKGDIDATARLIGC